MNDKILQLSGVTKRFDQLEAVDDVSLSFKEHELTAIIGPNGAGKTTLLNLISGALPLSSGDIIFQGESIKGLSPHELAKKGIIKSFQIVNQFPGFTPYQNIETAILCKRQTYNIKDQIKNMSSVKERTSKIMEWISIPDKNLPTNQLPYGVQRRVDVAISLALQPDLLLLDEPTSGAGTEEAKEIEKIIKDLTKELDLTVIFIEHDLELVWEIASRVVVLHQGRIIADGTPEEIRSDEEVGEIYGF